MHRVTLLRRCSVTHFDVSQIMSLDSYESKLQIREGGVDQSGGWRKGLAEGSEFGKNCTVIHFEIERDTLCGRTRVVHILFGRL